MAEMVYFSRMYSDFIYFYRLTSNLCMSLKETYTDEVWEKFKEIFPRKYIAVYKELNQIEAIDVENDITRLLTMEHCKFVLTFPLIGIGYDMNRYIEENMDKMVTTEQIYEETLNEIGILRNDSYEFKRKRDKKIKRG